MFSSTFVKALEDTNIPTAHFGWDKKLMPADANIVYEEDNAADLEANGLHIERATEGTVHLYTRDYSSTAKDPVESAFESLPGVVYSLEAIQFEEDTRFVHYTWSVGEYG